MDDQDVQTVIIDELEVNNTEDLLKITVEEGNIEEDIAEIENKETEMETVNE